MVAIAHRVRSWRPVRRTGRHRRSVGIPFPARQRALTMSSRRSMLAAGGHANRARGNASPACPRLWARLATSPGHATRKASMEDDFFSGSNGTSIVDVSSFFDSGFPDAMAKCVALGLLVSVGTTRDRGAISVTVTNDGRNRREYFRDSAEAADFLGMAAAAVQRRGLGVPTQEAPAPRKPTRGVRKPS